MSFKSDKPFNDFFHFPRGIRRSGRFSIKESELLEECGSVMTDLYTASRKPADDTEKEFVEQMKNPDLTPAIYAKVYQKYLREISPRKTHNLTASSDDDEGSMDSSESSRD